MSTTETISPSQAAIMVRTIIPATPRMNEQVAQFLLNVQFSTADRARVDLLAEKARSGRLTEAEDRELKDFIHVGHLLERLKSEARQALANA